MKNLARSIYESLFSYETRLRIYKLRHRELMERKRSVVNTSDKGDFSLKPYDEHRCIFVHITKTAGTAVAKSMFAYLPYHYTAIDYRVIYGKQDFNDYYKFAFVRNPWDRLYSAWRYLESGGWNDDDRQWFTDNLACYGDFEQFVLQWLDADKLQQHRHFWPQHQFVCDQAGNIIIDDVFYFETIDEDFSRACSKLGIDASLKPHNTNPGKNYRDVYSDKMRAIVANVYARDIELFGYEFDGIRQRHGSTAK